MKDNLIYQNVTCCAHCYISGKTLIQATIYVPITGISKETLINKGREIKSLADKLYGKNDLYPNVIKFYLPDGVYNWEMKQKVNYTK